MGAWFLLETNEVEPHRMRTDLYRTRAGAEGLSANRTFNIIVASIMHNTLQCWTGMRLS